MLSKTLSGYWLHQDDGSAGGKIVKDKMEDVLLELKKAPMDGGGKGM